jgi:hypothetical protein
MNYDSSYLEQYDNEYDIIVEKKNNHQIKIYNDNDNNSNEKNNMLILQNKVEELFLKLKFLNSNKKNMTIDILEYINDNSIVNNYNNLFDDNYFININNFNNSKNLHKNSNNIISLINKLILNLDTKIISKGQIKRKNNSIEFEF